MGKTIGSHRPAAVTHFKAQAKKPAKAAAEKVEAAKADSFQPVKPAPGPAVRASVLQLEADLNRNPDIQEFAKGRGWQLGVKNPAKPEAGATRVNLLSADLVFTTDGWKTTKMAQARYLMNGYQGFVLEGVAPGAKVEYAVHAQVGFTADGGYSYEGKGDLWLNNGGRNYTADSTKIPGT